MLVCIAVSGYEEIEKFLPCINKPDLNQAPQVAGFDSTLAGCARPLAIAKNPLAVFLPATNPSRMNFPPFWAKGSHQNFSCWRWSQRSLSEAEALAKEAALKLAERFASGGSRL